jgi:hypothetical protein
VNQIIKDGGGVVLVWGCMTSCGMGYMCNIEGKMTQGLYLSILQDEVMKTIEWHCFNPSWVIFQHDNDFIKILQNWVSSGCQYKFWCTWPPQSPNLKPMEHVWALVKWKSNEYPTSNKGLLQLWECVQASFHSITHKQCQKFYLECPIVSKLF